MEERLITRDHIFNFEMKYKEKLVKRRNHEYTEFSLKLLDNLINGDIFYSFHYNYDDTFQFVNDYKDIIKWYDLVYLNKIFIKANLKLFVDTFNQFFNRECWYEISDYFVESLRVVSKEDDLNSLCDLIKKYKSSLHWDIISRFKQFPIEFLYEMKDFVNFEIIANTNVILDENTLLEQMRLYCLDHLDEILTYKREE